MRKVVLYNVHHGKGERSCYIYAHLRDAETGELIISATLDYILEAVEKRDYLLVSKD
jgi:hypothetical protein